MTIGDLTGSSPTLARSEPATDEGRSTEEAAEGPLYPRLRARSRGLTSQEVIANQRRRLQGAMVEAVARHGYAAASVDAIVKLAGVSTRTLYERFGSKQGCFLATCEEVADQALGRIAHACWDGTAGDPYEQRPLEDGIAALAAEIAEHPKASALVLIEAPAIGPVGRPCVVRLQQRCEDMLSAALCRAADGQLPDTVTQGAVHGISHVSRLCLLDKQPQRMIELAPHLLRWLLSCASTRAARLGGGGTENFAEPPPQLLEAVAPATRAAPPGERGRRQHVLRVAAEIAARGGVEAASVMRICEVADIDFDAFVAEHGSAEQCLCAALELLSVEALASGLRVVGDRQHDAQQWCQALHQVVVAICLRIAEDLVLQRFVFAEMPESGFAALRRQTEIMRRFTLALTRRTPRSLQPPPGLADAFVGAFWGIARDHVLREEAHLLPARAGCLSYLLLSPLVGAQTAVEAIESAEPVAAVGATK